MFIELTDITDPKVTNDCYVNINHIISFKDLYGVSTIIQFDGAYLIVSESYEEVKSLIEHEVQAERGY